MLTLINIDARCMRLELSMPEIMNLWTCGVCSSPSVDKLSTIILQMWLLFRYHAIVPKLLILELYLVYDILFLNLVFIFGSFLLLNTHSILAQHFSWSRPSFLRLLI